MAFTYDPATDIGKVRLLVGDTREAEAVLSDEEIAYFLGEVDGPQAAAIMACDAVAARYAHDADFSQDDTSFKFSERAKLWQQRAADLRERFSDEGGVRSVRTQREDGYSTNLPNRGDAGSLSSSGRDPWYVGRGRGG